MTSNEFSEDNTRRIGEWDVGNILGTGSFAVVWKAKHRSTGQHAAIKEINLTKLNSRLRQSLESEVSILKRISHPHIVMLLEVLESHGRLYLIMEYCAGGDLANLIKTHGKLSEHLVRSMMRDLASGLHEMYMHHLVHRDLKPQNLLLTAPLPEDITSGPIPSLKIADFGFARALGPHLMAETLCGSPLYMAPEVLLSQKYDAKADLWSVGTIMYEMVVGTPPYVGSSQVVLLRKIREREVQVPAATAAGLSPPCTSLIHGLLKRNAAERISFEEFFHHPFITVAKSGDPLTSVVGFDDAAGPSYEARGAAAPALIASSPAPTPAPTPAPAPAPASPVTGGLLTEQLKPFHQTIRRPTCLTMEDRRKVDIVTSNRISTQQENVNVSLENAITENEEGYVLVTSPQKTATKASLTQFQGMFRQAQESDQPNERQVNETLFDDLPKTAMSVMALPHDVPWQSASRRQFLCHVANIIGSELSSGDHRELKKDGAQTSMGKASLLLAAIHLYTVAMYNCRGGLSAGDQVDQHQSIYSCSTDVSAHEDDRELLSVAKSECKSTLKKARAILENEPQMSSDVVPDPWILVYRWALLYAEDASTDELLGNYEKAQKLYAVAGTLFYFLASESPVLQEFQFGLDSVLFRDGSITESRLRHLASAAAVRWNVCLKCSMLSQGD